MGNGKRLAVFGAPREQDNGAVIIFLLDQLEEDFQKEDEKLGEKFGAGFGHSVTTVDVKMDE